MRVYRHGMRRDAASRQALRGLVGLEHGPVQWAANGQQSQNQTLEGSLAAEWE
jgi:hypothetical protein